MNSVCPIFAAGTSLEYPKNLAGNSVDLVF